MPQECQADGVLRLRVPLFGGAAEPVQRPLRVPRDAEPFAIQEAQLILRRQMPGFGGSLDKLGAVTPVIFLRRLC